MSDILELLTIVIPGKNSLLFHSVINFIILAKTIVFKLLLGARRAPNVLVMFMKSTSHMCARVPRHLSQELP